MQVECCVCRDWKDKSTHKWITPSVHARRDYHFHSGSKLSHSICPECYFLQLKCDGYTELEMKAMIEEIKEPVLI